MKKEEESVKILQIANQIDSSDYEDGEYEEVAMDEYYDSDREEDELMLPP